MTALVIETHTAEQTQEFGQRLGSLSDVGGLYLLRGTLGAGKTTLTQGFAWGAGAKGYAHSPTFVIVNEYAGRFPIYHVDLYRVEGGNLEAHDLGFEEMLEKGTCVVEWPEMAEEIFPGEHLSIQLDFGDKSEDRKLKVRAHGARYERLLEDLRRFEAL